MPPPQPVTQARGPDAPPPVAPVMVASAPDAPAPVDDPIVALKLRLHRPGPPRHWIAG